MMDAEIAAQLRAIRERPRTETDEEAWARYEAEHDTSTPDIEAAILAYYPLTVRPGSGLSFEQIAAKLGVGTAMVRNAGKRLERQGKLHIRTRKEVGLLHREETVKRAQHLAGDAARKRAEYAVRKESERA